MPPLRLRRRPSSPNPEIVMRRILAATAVILLLLAGGAWVSLRWLDAKSHEAYRGAGPDVRLVDLEPGLGVTAIGRRLAEAGVVPDVWLFRWEVWRRDATRRLQAGEYRFDRPLSVAEVVDKLARGDVQLWPVTFPEGLTIGAMSEVFERTGLGPAASFVEAAGRADLVRDLDPDATDLEGYLFPDTYAVPRGTPAVRLVEIMVARFREAFGPPLQAEAAGEGLTARQVVTLASLVEKETARAEERPLVAAVYRNRLRRHMLLQCDPTLIYALERTGRYDGNLRREDKAFDSPYNTYRYPGLPPGPIAAPGRASLEAAVRPADVGYLYFVSRNDGSHVFSSTLQEHNANVRRFQIRYFRERQRR
jgi:UPF0755 protein